MNNVVKRAPDVIDMRSYQAGYAGGYSEGLDGGYEVGYVACWLDIRRRAAAEQEYRNYICKQRILGLITLGITAAVSLVGMDLTFAFVGVPLGLGLIFAKGRWLG